MGVSVHTPGAEPHPGAPSSRTLSKSDFKLARTCEAKLYFRENRYPDNRQWNPYLALLAEGGYMVEALAKAKYPNGVQLTYGRDPAAELARTLDQLQRDEITLFEATLLVGRRMARVDILQKKGNTVRLLEVKSKSFDANEHTARVAGAFRGTTYPYRIRSEWVEKLEDLTFQTLLLEQLMPGVVVEPYLVLVDKTKRAAVDDVPSMFELVLDGDGEIARLQTARYVGAPESLALLDLLTEVDVREEVALLRGEVDVAALALEQRLDAPLSDYLPSLVRGGHCAKCEFRRDETNGSSNDQRDGFVDCWGSLADAKPHMLELYSIGTARAPDKSPLVAWMVGQSRAGLLDIPLDGLVASVPVKPGGVAVRQRRQIEHTRSGEPYIGPALRAKVQSLRGPLHFIDFETSRLALPYHAGMRPYGLVAFQWSCHMTSECRSTPRHQEWLNDVDVWPNQLFAQSLRDAIGDAGPVLTWSHFEATTLKQIVPELARFGYDAPELVEWMTDVVAHRIVDLHDWARCDYYHPAMRGRTSIKLVLDALWRADPVMREQFIGWTGLPADETRGPYASLPPVEIHGMMVDVHEGTGAMRAYQEMMYGADKRDREVRSKWAGLLRQYCALDTLSMVLILEHWSRAVAV